jgi:hypothetical protein
MAFVRRLKGSLLIAPEGISKLSEYSRKKALSPLIRNHPSSKDKRSSPSNFGGEIEIDARRSSFAQGLTIPELDNVEAVVKAWSKS